MAGVRTEGPRVCEWEITLACDLSCEHCCARAGTPRPGELTRVEALAMAAQIAGIGCRAVTLTGGEPLLRPDWPDLAVALADGGARVAMATSGSTVDRRTALAMRAAGIFAASVSLDGPERIHDGIRGSRGSFRLAVRAVGLLRDAGIDAGFATVLTRRNRAEIQRVHEIAAAAGASFWQVHIGAPSGLRRDGLWLTPRDLVDLVPEIAGLQRSSPIEVIPGDDLGCWAGHRPFRAPRSDEPRRWSGCQAGNGSVGVLSDGGVTGCLAMAWHGHRGPTFVEGNARGDTLGSIWTRPGAFGFARDLGPDSMAGACAACGRAATCGGGCLWVASIGEDKRVENRYCRLLQAGSRLRPMDGNSRARVPAAIALGLGLAIGGCHHQERDVAKPVAGPEKCMEEPQADAQVQQAEAAPVESGCEDAAVPVEKKCEMEPCCYMRAMIPNCNCCWDAGAE